MERKIIITEQPKCKTCGKLMFEWDAWADEHEHEEMQEEERIEKQLESQLERAASCTRGAYQIIGMVEPIQVADCCCGAG